MSYDKSMKEVRFTVCDISYQAKTGRSMEETVMKYGCLAALASFAIGAAGGGFAANEAMELLASDAPTAVCYAADGLAALVTGITAGHIGNRIGWHLGARKIKKVLKDEKPIE